MRDERLSALPVGPADWSQLRQLDNAILDSLAGLRRGIERELQNRRRQRADGHCEQGNPFDEVRIRAQQTDVSQRVAQERVVALEALGQFLLLRGRGGETVERRGVQAFFQRFRPEPSDCRNDLRHGGVDRIVVLEQAGPGQKHIAVQRGLGEGKIVEGLERRRILGRAGRDPAQQRPGQQREQQTRCSRAGQQSHWAAAFCDHPRGSVSGLPR